MTSSDSDEFFLGKRQKVTLVGMRKKSTVGLDTQNERRRVVWRGTYCVLASKPSFFERSRLNHLGQTVRQCDFLWVLSLVGGGTRVNLTMFGQEFARDRAIHTCHGEEWYSCYPTIKINRPRELVAAHGSCSMFSWRKCKNNKCSEDCCHYNHHQSIVECRKI